METLSTDEPLVFAGYRSFEATPDDPLRVKWNAMRANLDVPGFTPPVTTMAGISVFNRYINHTIVFNQLENEDLEAWQSPAQTLMQAQGDCKDYALLKYAVLLTIGIPVQITIGEIASANKFNKKHAWCAAHIDGKWYALDNDFDQLEPLPYANWIPDATMHDAEVKRYGLEFSIAEIESHAR